MTVHIKLFALAREVVGRDALTLELPESATVADFRRCLAEQFPDLAAMVPQMMIAVGADYAADDQRLLPGAEVACIPPVSGGAP